MMTPFATRLRFAHGTTTPGEHWCAPPTPSDELVLTRARPPVLDIGCGPGRHVLALAERGMVAMGVDVTPTAVAWARRRGAAVLERSVFDRVPGHGRWRTALLLDGNVGIGGDPVGLLLRVAALLAPEGRTIVELAPTLPDPHRTRGRTAARLELAGITGPWFPWTTVHLDELVDAAHGAGLAVHDRWNHHQRHFVELGRAPPLTPA
jgi:SAM-dependent methyltransferase